MTKTICPLLEKEREKGRDGEKPYIGEGEDKERETTMTWNDNAGGINDYFNELI